MPLTPEQQARRKIDQLLEAAGWVIQDYPHSTGMPLSVWRSGSFRFPAVPVITSFSSKGRLPESWRPSRKAIPSVA